MAEPKPSGRRGGRRAPGAPPSGPRPPPPQSRAHRRTRKHLTLTIDGDTWVWIATWLGLSPPGVRRSRGQCVDHLVKLAEGVDYKTANALELSAGKIRAFAERVKARVSLPENEQDLERIREETRRLEALGRALRRGGQSPRGATPAGGVLDPDPPPDRAS